MAINGMMLFVLTTMSCPIAAHEVVSELNAKRAKQVDQMFADWDKPGSPGCAVGIVRDGKLIYSKGFGYANLDFDILNSSRTVFETGYFFNSFTCACLALLMDEGKISPDDDVRKYVPEMHEFKRPIRIRHLIGCRTGLRPLYTVLPLAGWGNLPVQYPSTEADVLAVVTRQKSLPFETGKEYRFGSADYLLLATIVKRVTGQSIAEFSRQKIFDPLHMTSTHFNDDPTLVVKNRAMGYERFPWPDGELRQWKSNGYDVFGPDGSSCVEDLYRWDQNFYDNQLPHGKFMDEFISNGTLLDNRPALDVDPTGRYRGLKRIQFTGGNFAFAACMTRYPEQHFTFICLTNQQGTHPWANANGIADIYLSDHLKPTAKSKKPENTPSSHEETIVDIPESKLRTKVGAYRMQGLCNRVWQVALKDKQLSITDHLNHSYPLKAVSDIRFHTHGAPKGFDRHALIFKQDASDKPFYLTISGAEGEQIFDRVEMVDPTPAALHEYDGRYFCDELSATYQFSVRDGALWVRINSRGWERLDPTIRDTFIPHLRVEQDSRFFNFHRNESGKIVGFDLDYFEAQDLYFEKKGNTDG